MINDKPGSAADIRADMLVDVKWLGAHRFDAGRPGGPTNRIHPNPKQSTSPP